MQHSPASNEDLDRIIRLWEAQQDAAVRDRAGRFSLILDVIADTRPAARTFLDLGGGPGSFARLLLERFPEARVLVVDDDPALLALARHNLRAFGERAVIVEADLADPHWNRALQGDEADVVVSSTALHWLSTSALVGLYESLFSVLATGGLFVNADHFSYRAEGSFFAAASDADDVRRRDTWPDGVPDWWGWWEEFSRLPSFAPLIAERDRRFADIPETLDATPALHTEALRVAGFTEVGTLWQRLDDYVVYGVRG